MGWLRSTTCYLRWPSLVRGAALLLVGLLLGHAVAMAAEGATVGPPAAEPAATVLSPAKPSLASTAGAAPARHADHDTPPAGGPSHCGMMQASLAPPIVLGTGPLACTAASALEAPAVVGPPREPSFGSTGPLPPRHTVRQALLQVFLH